MTPEIRQAIRLRAMKECPHWGLGDKMDAPCFDCELGAAIAEEREACATIADERDARWLESLLQNRTVEAEVRAVEAHDIAEAIRGRTP